MKLSTFEAFKHLSSEVPGAIELSQEQLEKVHEVLLKIMDDVVSVCEKNELCYFLGGGSALGALRHKGFIPWDDDIDVNMPRKDYEQFLKLFRAQYGEKYWIQTPQETSNYGLSLAKIRKKGTVMMSRDDWHTNECGIGIDIFVIENMFDNPVLRTLHGVLCLGMGYLLSCKKFCRDKNELRRIAHEVPEVRGTFYLKIAIGFLLTPLSLDWLCQKTDACHRLCKNNDSKYVSGCAGRLHFFGEMYRRDDFCEVRKEDFEGRRWNVPIDAEGYLTHCYGDWKEIPAEKDKERHYIYKFECEE